VKAVLLTPEQPTTETGSQAFRNIRSATLDMVCIHVASEMPTEWVEP
jgi:hypothetical protein